MNRKLRKQIKAYTGLAGALLVTDKASSQVIYVDIFPDDTLKSYGAFHLDINQDGDTDFVFFGDYFHSFSNGGDSWNSYALIAFGKNIGNDSLIKASPALCGSFGFGHASLLNPADTIPKSAPVPVFNRWVTFENWMTHINTNNSTFFSSCFTAAGALNQDNCVGLKFTFNGQPHYGWIRVELLNKKLVIKDYAYQLQPNVPILSCDTSNLATQISEYNHQQFIFSQQNNSIHISTFQKSNHANISVYDLLGKEILQQPFEGEETTITLDKKGIYFVEVKSDKGIFRKKVFIY